MTNNENNKDTILTVEERLQKIASYSEHVQRKTDQLHGLSLLFSNAIDYGHCDIGSFDGAGDLLAEISFDVNEKTQILVDSLFDLIKAIKAKREAE